jgi:hypothetical protein
MIDNIVYHAQHIHCPLHHSLFSGVLVRLALTALSCKAVEKRRSEKRIQQDSFRGLGLLVSRVVENIERKTRERK